MDGFAFCASVHMAHSQVIGAMIGSLRAKVGKLVSAASRGHVFLASPGSFKPDIRHSNQNVPTVSRTHLAAPIRA